MLLVLPKYCISRSHQSKIFDHYQVEYDMENCKCSHDQEICFRPAGGIHDISKLVDKWKKQCIQYHNLQNSCSIDVLPSCQVDG